MTRSFLHFVLIFVILALLTTGSAHSESKGMTLDIDGLYRQPSLIGTQPTSAAWSHDSNRVAFAWNDQGGSFRDLWAWSTGDEAPVRLTHYGQSGSGPGISELAWLGNDPDSLVYSAGDTLYLHVPGQPNDQRLAKGAGLRLLTPSPDGLRLAFVSNEGLWFLSFSTRDAPPVLVLDNEAPANRISSLEWSANSARLAFMQTDFRPLPERKIHYYTKEGHQVSNVRRAFPGDETALYRIGVIEAASGKARFLERPDEREYIWNYGISSDGRQLFVNGSDLLVKHHRIDLYDVDSGQRQVFYQEHDPLHLRPDWRAAWAPGDEGLIILTDRDGYLHLYHQPDAQAKPRALTSGNWEIADFRMDPAGNRIHFLSNRSHLADKQLYRLNLASGDIKRITDTSHGTHRPVYSPDMRHTVSLFSDDQTPHDLYHVDLETGSTARITRSPHPDFDRQQWARVRYVEFPSRTDGVNLVGRLSLPPNHDPDRRYPLIVGSVYSDSVLNQWGGRQSHPTWGLDQYLVAQGYIILNVNIRGSWGQGRKHNQGLRYSYGIIDIEDLHSGVEYLVREGYADSERVGIWGSSYGGLMTMMSLFKKPGVYAAGIAGAPATNVAHAYPGQMWVMGEPTGDDQPGRYESQSALFHSAGLNDPLMIIHGTRDQVVLYSDTVAVVQDLINREQDFELVTLPGVGHGWDNEAPEVRRFAFRKMVDFFDRHLKRP